MGKSLYLSGYTGICFFTNGINKATISRNGNFGIGPEKPKNKLEVQGKIRAEEIMKVETKADRLLKINNLFNFNLDFYECKSSI